MYVSYISSYKFIIFLPNLILDLHKSQITLMRYFNVSEITYVNLELSENAYAGIYENLHFYEKFD